MYFEWAIKLRSYCHADCVRLSLVYFYEWIRVLSMSLSSNVLLYRWQTASGHRIEQQLISSSPEVRICFPTLCAPFTLHRKESLHSPHTRCRETFPFINAYRASTHEACFRTVHISGDHRTLLSRHWQELQRGCALRIQKCFVLYHWHNCAWTTDLEGSSASRTHRNMLPHQERSIELVLTLAIPFPSSSLLLYSHQFFFDYLC